MTKGERTKQEILDVGLSMWPNVTARGIARKMETITHPAVLYHFGDKLQDAVAEYAVEIGNSRVIAHLIVTKHKAIRKLTAKERAKHLNSVT